MQDSNHAGLSASRSFGQNAFTSFANTAVVSSTGFNIEIYVLIVNPSRYVLFLSDNLRLYLVSSPDSAVRMHDLEVRHCTIHIPTAKSFLYFLTVGISCDYHKVTIHIITSFVLVVSIRNRFVIIINGIITAFGTFSDFLNNSNFLYLCFICFASIF